MRGGGGHTSETWAHTQPSFAPRSTPHIGESDSPPPPCYQSLTPNTHRIILRSKSDPVEVFLVQHPRPPGSDPTAAGAGVSAAMGAAMQAQQGQYLQQQQQQQQLQQQPGMANGHAHEEGSNQPSASAPGGGQQQPERVQQLHKQPTPQPSPVTMLHKGIGGASPVVGAGGPAGMKLELPPAEPGAVPQGERTGWASNDASSIPACAVTLNVRCTWLLHSTCRPVRLDHHTHLLHT